MSQTESPFRNGNLQNLIAVVALLMSIGNGAVQFADRTEARVMDALKSAESRVMAHVDDKFQTVDTYSQQRHVSAMDAIKAVEDRVNPIVNREIDRNNAIERRLSAVEKFMELIGVKLKFVEALQ